MKMVDGAWLVHQSSSSAPVAQARSVAASHGVQLDPVPLDQFLAETPIHLGRWRRIVALLDSADLGPEAAFEDAA